LLLAMKRIRRFVVRSLLSRITLLMLWGYSVLRGRPVICLTARHGQLGNRLFLGAHLIATAMQNRLEVLNLSFSDYAALLETSHQDAFCRFPHRRTPSLRRLDGFRDRCLRWVDAAGALIPTNKATGAFLHYQLGDPEEIFDCNSPSFRRAVTQARVIFMRGWSYRNYAELATHAPAVRQHLRPRADILDRCQTFAAKFRHGIDVLIGVHIRQGDYRTAWGGGLFFETQQYVAWMRLLQSQFPNQRVGFFIASNEVQRPESFDGLNCHQLPAEAIPSRQEALGYDMTLLSLCDYILAPPSTFSGWASFINQVPIHFIRTSGDTIDRRDFRVCQLNECHGW
jgi:hypothetical protein